MEFGEFKQQVIEFSKNLDACKEGFAQLQKAESWFDLCVIVRESFEWCVENKLITPELIKEHWIDCKKAGIFLNENVTNGFVIVTSGNEVTVCGNSFVIAFDDAVVSAYDTSYVIAHEKSEVLAYDHCYVKACDNAKVTCYDYAGVSRLGNPDISVSKGYVYDDLEPAKETN